MAGSRSRRCSKRLPLRRRHGRCLLTTPWSWTRRRTSALPSCVSWPPLRADDVDSGVDGRRHAVSVFNGAPPEVRTFDTPEDESTAVGAWLRAVIDGGTKPGEIGIFVRSLEQAVRAQAATAAAGLVARVLDERVEIRHGGVSIAPMHLAKGLEFRAVAVMACDDEVLPSQARIEEVGEGGDLQEVYDTERQLLYVACTRARDTLWVSGVKPESEFLADLSAP